MANTTEKRTVQIVMDGKQPSNTMKGLTADIRTLNKSLRDLPSTSKEFEIQAKKLRELQKEYQDLKNKVSYAGQSLQYFKSQLEAVAIGTIGGNLITGIGSALSQYVSGSIQYMADLSDELANIRKTTGLSAEGIDKLNKSLSQIDTRTSKKSLREIAVGLGQIGEEANLDNIRAIDKVVVALGDEFGGSAQEITNAVSILRNNLTDFKTGNYADDILKIGNALNELGAKGLATASVVTDFATRMSGVLQAFGVSTAQTLGLSAAMQELGISVERGSTAVTKLVQKMAQNPEVFAKVAGAKTKKEVEEFIELLNKDAVAALLKVAKGAKSAGNSNTEFAGILKELESTGAGVGEVLSKFSQNADLVTEKVNLSTEALQNSNSINTEFALLNENNAAKIEKLKKAFSALTESDTFNKFLTTAINATIDFIKWTKEAGAWINKNIAIIKIIAITVITYVASIKLATIWQARKIALDKLEAIGVRLIVGAIKGAILVQELLTKEITFATFRQRLYNAALLANPFAAAAAGIALVTASLIYFAEAAKNARDAAELKFSNDSLKKSMDERKQILSDAETSILEDVKNGNKAKLEVDKAALEAANEIRAQEIAQLKMHADASKKVLDNVEKRTYAGITATFDKSTNIMLYPSDMKKRQVLADNAKKDYEDAVANQTKYTDLKQQVADKIGSIGDAQLEKEKEITAEQKREKEKQLELQRKFNEELQKILNDVERAKIEAIEEEDARELLFLQNDKEQKDAQINQEIDAQIKLAKEIGKGTAVIKKLQQDRAFLLLGIDAKYQRDRESLIDKQNKERTDTAFKKEIDAVTQKYEAEKLLEKQLYAEGISSKEKYEAQIQDLDRQSKVELLAISEKYGKSTNELKQAIADADMKSAEERKEKLMNSIINDAEIRVSKANNNLNKSGNKFSNLKESYDAETELLIAKLAKELGITELNEENILKIKTLFSEKFEEKHLEFLRTRMQRIEEVFNQTTSALSSGFDAITSAISQQYQTEMDMLNVQKDAELAALEDKKNKKIIYEDEYQREKDKINAKAAAKERELKRKQAKMDKATAIFSIGLNTAQAIMQTYATYGATPQGIALAAVAGIIGAIQLGVAAAKPIPYAKGGKFLGDVMTGPSHSDGGMPVINPTTGNVVAELEGGEPILSKKTYANNKQIVDALLHTSQSRNGAKIPSYFNAPTKFAYGGVMGAYQSTTLARSGYQVGNSSNTQTTIINENSELKQLVKDQGEFLRKMSEKLDQPIYGVWDYDYYTKSKATIEKNNKIGSVG